MKMQKKYENKFVRLGKGWLWPTSEADTYKEVIHEYAKEGWRLVQVFAPSRGMWGLANFHELILEKKLEAYPKQ